MDRPDIIIVAAEPSGDQLGADLARSLKSREPGLRVEGLGGQRMTDAGLAPAIAMDGLAILGFVEGLRAYGHVLKMVRRVSDHILSRDPRAVVLIDSWGFMVRVAKRLKAKGYPGHVVKYVAPQVWAMRSGRAKILARHVDHLLSTQPMDAPFFEAAGLPQTYVGNPVLDRDYRKGDAGAFRERHGLDPHEAVLGLFPGSRMMELDRLLPTLRVQTQRVSEALPRTRMVWVVASAISKESGTRIMEAAGPDAILIGEDELVDAMAAMTAAIAASGTITTQLACAGVPTVVIYKLSGLTYAVAKRLFRPPYISIVNIAANEELMPEFMQDDADSAFVADAVLRYLQTPDVRDAASTRLIGQTRGMGAGQQNASDRAAEALQELLRSKQA